MAYYLQSHNNKINSAKWLWSNVYKFPPQTIYNDAHTYADLTKMSLLLTQTRQCFIYNVFLNRLNWNIIFLTFFWGCYTLNAQAISFYTISVKSNCNALFLNFEQIRCTYSSCVSWYIFVRWKFMHANFNWIMTSLYARFTVPWSTRLGTTVAFILGGCQDHAASVKHNRIIIQTVFSLSRL